MGLRFCGVDFITKCDIALPPESKKFTVLEINAVPGLDHYALIGKKQKALVEELYGKVLRALMQ